MSELSQPLFQSHAPYIVLTAKHIIKVQASITYAFVRACTDSINLCIPQGTKLFTNNTYKRYNMGLIQCEIISHRNEIDAYAETLVRNKFSEFCDEYSKLSCVGSIYIAPSQLECFDVEDATDDDVFATFNIR